VAKRRVPAKESSKDHGIPGFDTGRVGLRHGADRVQIQAVSNTVETDKTLPILPIVQRRLEGFAAGSKGFARVVERRDRGGTIVTKRSERGMGGGDPGVPFYGSIETIRRTNGCFSIAFFSRKDHSSYSRTRFANS
jgi:hypothetical protein